MNEEGGVRSYDVSYETVENGRAAVGLWSDFNLVQLTRLVHRIHGSPSAPSAPLIDMKCWSGEKAKSS